MADVATAIRRVLASAPGVTGVVQGRIYPDYVPQDAKLPAIRYQLIDGESTHHLTDATGTARASVQVDCYSQTRIGATALEDAARLALDRYVGTSEGVTIRAVLSGNLRHDYEPPIDASDVGAYVAGRTYEVWHREAT